MPAPDEQHAAAPTLPARLAVLGLSSLPDLTALCSNPRRDLTKAAADKLKPTAPGQLGTKPPPPPPELAVGLVSHKWATISYRLNAVEWES